MDYHLVTLAGRHQKQAARKMNLICIVPFDR
jgi:hypothetical protein